MYAHTQTRFILIHVEVVQNAGSRHTRVLVTEWSVRNGSLARSTRARGHDGTFCFGDGGKRGSFQTTRNPAVLDICRSGLALPTASHTMKSHAHSESPVEGSYVLEPREVVST
jgi:hypothetical protein